MPQATSSRTLLHEQTGFSPQFAVPENVSERPIKNVPQPVKHKPTDADFYRQNERGESVPNHKYLKKHFFDEGRVTEKQALFILERTTALMRQEPNLLVVKSPVTSECIWCIHINQRLTIEKYAGTSMGNMYVVRLIQIDVLNRDLFA
ncbi:hypothetical protein H0H81_012154 [Sphagnurus paluster]|uniref:Uncharacterized protein n=1 Tax=Sphagnurus paluster TaxID=117069 RepID=A0A9P7G112_9AGAR|nr:hypothetical protein H0H81_012154 [Sphagnurus paluster]